MNALFYKNILLKTTLTVLFGGAICLSNKAFAQIKVGDNVANVQKSSLLELESNKKGLLLSRLADTLLINALNPPDGMVIFYNNGNHQAMMVRHYGHWAEVLTSDSLKNYIQPLAKNITSNSSAITIQNGTGAVLQATIIDVDITAIGHWLTTHPLNDSLAAALTTGAAKDTLLSFIGKQSFTTDNGLTQTGTNIALGGTLIQPTTLTTNATNTLALTGLQSGDVSTDSLLVANANTGIIKRVSVTMLGKNTVKTVYIATTGQTQFTTPYPINDLNKVQVYRNGNEIDFTATIGTNTLNLTPDNVFDNGCFAGDEIKIVQHY